MTKITAFAENTTPDNADLLVMVDDPAGTAATQKITLENAAAIGYWHEFHLPGVALGPGSSGATFVPPDGNTVGGWMLDASGEKLYSHVHVENDWDAASDLEVQVTWETNADNSGGSAPDTVDMKLIATFKGDGETAVKSQTIEVAHVIGAVAQYSQHTTIFAIDYDSGTDPVQAGDAIGFAFNLETDTSEVDNIVVNFVEFRYRTAQPGELQ